VRLVDLDAVEPGLLAAERRLGPHLDEVQHFLVRHLAGDLEQARLGSRVDARRRLRLAARQLRRVRRPRVRDLDDHRHVVLVDGLGELRQARDELVVIDPHVRHLARAPRNSQMLSSMVIMPGPYLASPSYHAMMRSPHDPSGSA